jgi:hypothetical protein
MTIATTIAAISIMLPIVIRVSACRVQLRLFAFLDWLDSRLSRFPGCRLSLAQRLEGHPKLGGEQLGLFPGGEVAAPADLVEVAQAGVAPLDPAARGAEGLAGEYREAGRELDLRGSLAGGR